MSKDERGGNVRRQGGKEQRRYGEEGERGERENAEAAVCTHVEVGCVCVCVCNEMLASIRLQLVPPHRNTAAAATTTTLPLPHQAD